MLANQGKQKEKRKRHAVIMCGRTKRQPPPNKWQRWNNFNGEIEGGRPHEIGSLMERSEVHRRCDFGLELRVLCLGTIGIMESSALQRYEQCISQVHQQMLNVSQNQGTPAEARTVESKKYVTSTRQDHRITASAISCLDSGSKAASSWAAASSRSADPCSADPWPADDFPASRSAFPSAAYPAAVSTSAGTAASGYTPSCNSAVAACTAASGYAANSTAASAASFATDSFAAPAGRCSASCASGLCPANGRTYNGATWLQFNRSATGEEVLWEAWGT